MLGKEGVMRKAWVVVLAVVAMWIIYGCGEEGGTGTPTSLFSDMDDSTFQTITEGMSQTDVLEKASQPVLDMDADGNGVVMFRSEAGFVYRVEFEKWEVTKTEKISDEDLRRPEGGGGG